MKVTASVPVQGEYTVGEFIDTLTALPRDAKVRIRTHQADRFGTDWHTVEISWEQ